MIVKEHPTFLDHWLISEDGDRWTTVAGADTQDAAIRLWTESRQTPVVTIQMVRDEAVASLKEAEVRELARHFTPGKSDVYRLQQAEALAVFSGFGATRAERPLLAAMIGTLVPDTGNDATDIRAAATLTQSRSTAAQAAAAAIESVVHEAKTAIAAAQTAAAVQAIMEAVRWP